MSIDPTDRALPASANFEKLKVKLRELFELDKADLDFGIYRILRVRHKEIAEFLDKHLEKTVREALQLHNTVHQTQAEEDLRKAELAAKEAGIAPEQSPRVMEIREKMHDENSIDALADEVYSQLYTFFSRYYQEGDFLGLQRSTVHGRERYMIPYNGEEVKLVWANMDQYYIKSSELLRDYTFHVTPGEGTLLKAAANERTTIHFKLVEGDTEKDNRKPSGKTTRAFALDAEMPFNEDAIDTLTIRFRYRELAAERNLQDKLNADTEKTLADNLPQKWKEVLFAADTGYQGKDKKDIRTILQKHLRTYTAKHQFDYFIHKDLGGFLRRELDFYIKNEVMYLDDIENVGAPKAEEYLSKIRALRRCALPVIGMLEQLENFQKKLWLKKKFVVETRYCLTLDRVPEALYQEIADNAAQCEEWVKLYAINEIEPNLLQPGHSDSLTIEFLKANPYLMLDTRHFNRDFTLKLLAAIDNLDESLDGICFHSENFQALQLMQERYREQVKCVYIDPPYNTAASKIAYKNEFQHSSWLSMMVNRLSASIPLLRQDTLYAIAIDDFELAELRLLCDAFSSRLTIEACVPIRTKPQGRAVPTGFSPNHDYVVFFSCGPMASVGRLPRNEEKIARYRDRDEGGIFTWANLRATGANSTRAARPKLFYPIYVNEKLDVTIPELKWDEKNGSWVANQQLLKGEKLVLPIDDDGTERVWTIGNERATAEINELQAKANKGKIQIYRKYRPNQEGALPGTWWDNPSYSASESGTKILAEILGPIKEFTYPKSIFAVIDSLRVLGLETGIVLDFFGGSGTTGHAVINLNREDGGNRKYLLVEIGEYFDTVLVPRLKKVVYSVDWKGGNPQSRNTGISHAFKIVRLESYEDALNNLRLKRTPEQEAALQAAPEKARDQYMLSYFLDVESAGSTSLLDLDQFRDPFAYKLKIATASAGETKETTIDLVETFNWLLGLKVNQMKTQQGFLTVTGEKCAGGRSLVIWRTLSGDAVADNAALEKFLNELKVKPADTEYDYIYVNGSHTLTDPQNKVHLIEEAFQRLMFDGGSFESLE